MPTALENRIAAQERKLVVIDDRIARIMSRRVEEEDKLAKLYEQRNKAGSNSSHVAKAEAYEAAGDWQRAAMHWYYAADKLTGNPHGLRTEYNRREDAAKAKARES